MNINRINNKLNNIISFIDNYNKNTLILFNKIKFLFDNDLKLTIKDRLMAPKYKTYIEKDLKTYLKSLNIII